MAKLLNKIAGGFVGGALLVAALSTVATNEHKNVFSSAENETYALHINTKNPIVSSQIKNDNGFNLWAKGDSGSGVNFSYSADAFSISKGGYIQNLSAINGITSVAVTITSGSVELFYDWKEPSDLESPEYEAGYVFTTSGTYTFDDVSPSRVRIKALENSVLSDIAINYSCTGSTDDNSESIEQGLENGYFDAGALNTFANLSYVTGEGNVGSDDSSRALKLTFKGTTNNYVSFDTSHNKRANLIAELPDFSDKTFEFKAKFSSNVTDTAMEVCAIENNWGDSTYIEATPTYVEKDGWTLYKVDFAQIPFTGNNQIIRVNVRPKGINSDNKDTAYILLDEVNYYVSPANRRYRAESYRDGWENMLHDTGWENMNYSYSTEEVFGGTSTSSLMVHGKKSDKSKNNSFKYFTSFDVDSSVGFTFDEAPDLSTGYITFNYKPLFVNSPATIYYGVYIDWGTDVATGTITGTKLMNGWYMATIDCSTLSISSNAPIRLNFGWDIDDANLNKATIYIDNLVHTTGNQESYTVGWENMKRDTGWEKCIATVDYNVVATSASTNSIRTEYGSLSADANNGYGIMLSTQAQGINSGLNFTSGILEAKFLFTSNIVDKTVRLIFIDSDWKGNRYDVQLTELGNGWWSLYQDLTQLPAKVQGDAEYDALDIIRVGFGFRGVTANNKSTAKVWIDDVFYTNNSYSSVSSYSNATIYQSYETENYVRTAKAVSGRTISSSNPLKFAGLKNDVESNQLVIKMNNNKSVSSFNLRVESLRNSQGYVLDSSFIDVLVPQYISVPSDSAEKNNSSYGWQGADDYPDALLPMATAAEYGLNKIEKHYNISKGGYQQAIWINVNIPKFIKAGVYTGNAILNIDGTNYNVPMEVTIYGATLPDEVHNKTSFLIWYDQIEKGEGYSNKGIRRAYYDYFLTKRINADSVRGLDYYGSAEGFAEWFEQNVAFNEKISTYRFPAKGDGSLSYDDTYEYLCALADRNKALWDQGKHVNFFDKLVVYFHDEPSTAQQWSNLATSNVNLANAKQAASSRLDGYPELQASLLDVQQVTPFNVDYSDMNPTKFHALDTPCPTFDHLNNASERSYYQNNYDHLWWYGCILPLLPYPSFHIDSRLIGDRMITWMQYAYGIEGNIYYCVNYNQRTDYSETVDSDPYSDPLTNGKGAGDGRLVYPGSPYGIYGPVSSMRLEEIRASMEDYEYFWMIDQRIDKYNQIHGTNYTSISEKLLADYIPSMTNGTDIKTSFTSATLESYRLQILQIVDELY